MLTPDILERSSVLTNIAEDALEGDPVTLHMTEAMADAWLEATGAESRGLLWHLGSSSLQLTQQQVLRNA